MAKVTEGKIEMLAIAVARGEPVAVAGRALGLADRTAYEHAARSEFKARVAALRRELFAAAVGMLADATAGAIATLRELCGPDSPPTVRCSASRAILDNAVSMQSHVELNERVSELEARLNESSQSNQSAVGSDGRGRGPLGRH